MLIDRPLAHKVQSKLTSVLCFIDMGKPEAAKIELREISKLVNSYVESEEEERVRKENAERDDAR
jgi:hypothetical protein